MYNIKLFKKRIAIYIFFFFLVTEANKRKKSNRKEKEKRPPKKDYSLGKRVPVASALRRFKRSFGGEGW
jgi:hypothetical protein